MNWKIIISIVLLIFPLTCLAYAGMYDRFLDTVDWVDSLFRIILIFQILIFLLVTTKWIKFTKHIRRKILLVSGRFTKNRWINLIAAWILSSFVLSIYISVFCIRLFIAALPFYTLFWIIYIVAVLWKGMRKRCLSGIRAIYYYIVLSIGQILGFTVYYLGLIIEWYSPWPDSSVLFNKILGFNYNPWFDAGYYLISGMFYMALLFAIPYLLLIIIYVIRMGINKIRNI